MRRRRFSDARIGYDRAVQDLRMALGLPYDAHIVVDAPTLGVRLLTLYDFAQDEPLDFD